MRSDFSIVSDGSCDLPEEITMEKNIEVVHFLVSLDQKEYKKEGIEIELGELYQQMVEHPGTYPKTAAPSPEDFYRAFEKGAQQGQNIICVCISTKLSSSVQSAQIAAQMLEEDYPGIRVAVLDSLCATLMQGAYVQELCRLREEGCPFDQAVEIMLKLRSTGRILFTVGDLDYIQHGGRIGKVTSLAGTLLNVKPMITLQDGEIHSSGIRRGRRKSLEGILDLLITYFKENHCTPNDCTFAIGYSYDYEEACRLQKLTEERLNSLYGTTDPIPVRRIGATIGVHAGPTSVGYGIVRRSTAFYTPVPDNN